MGESQAGQQVSSNTLSLPLVLLLPVQLLALLTTQLLALLLIQTLLVVLVLPLHQALRVTLLNKYTTFTSSSTIFNKSAEW